MLSSTKSRLAGKTLLQTLLFFLLVTQICFAQGSWTHISDMPELRLAHTANELEGKIYIVGGMNTEQGTLPTTMLVYDRIDTTWTTIRLLNNEFRTAHTSRVANGKLYVIGGWTTDGVNYFTSSKVDMYDPNFGLWTSKNAMPTHRANIASALIDGKIYVMGGLQTVGGVVNYTGLKTLEAYDLSTETWDTTLADMPTGRWGLSAVAYNGKIYVFGGTTGIGATVYSSVMVYDPETNTWTVTSHNMPTPRYQLTTCELNNYIYAIDGWFSSDNGPIYDKVEVYNPENDTWYTETPMPVARAVLASVVLDGKIQVFGGSSTLHPLIGSSGMYEFTNNEPLPAGTYTIGTGGNFATIQDAFNKLETDGIAGAVTLELIDEFYTAPTGQYGYVLNGPITGASPSSRVTLRPAENKNVTIEGSNEALLYLMNTSYVTFDGVAITGPTTLTIHALQNGSYTFNDALDFMNNSDHNVIQNIIFIVEKTTSASGAGFWFTQTGSAPDSNLIQNNFVKKAGDAFFMVSASSSLKGKDNVIRGNQIGSETDSLISFGIDVSRCENSIIENNIVQNLKATIPGTDQVQTGILSTMSSGTIIRNNVLGNFRASSGYNSSGIFLGGQAADMGYNNLVYNNMIYDIQSTSSQNDSRVTGIQMWYQNNPKIYYNSVYLSGIGAQHLGSAALYIGGGNTGIDSKNNIFVNTRDESPYCASAIYDQTASNLTSDYNDLYYESNQYNCMVRAGGTDYLTLADWQATGKDLNSISEMPNFVTPDLHIADNSLTMLDGGATPIAEIETDIDGETRNATVPDIGADEFTIVGVEDETTFPTEFSLEQNYPNPFNPSTTLRYSIPTQSNVVIKVFDILGNEIATLMDEEKSVGNYELTWNAASLPSGVYFYQLKAGEFVSTKKMILLK